MSNSGGDDHFFQIDKRQFAIIDQLPKVVRGMHNVDELFRWVAQAIIQTFNAQVIELWVSQTNAAGLFFTELRMLVYQDLSLPQHVVANTQVMQIAEQMLNARQDYPLHMVGNIFPNYPASLLTRYGLNYCCSCFLRSNAVLPAVNGRPPGEILPRPLVGTVMLFLQQSVPQGVFQAIKLILEQTVLVASSRGLLLPRVTTDGRLPRILPNPTTSRSPTQSLPKLPERSPQPLASSPDYFSQLPVNFLQFVIHRNEDANLMTSSNPLAGGVVISDKQARRLYSAIDGYKNIEELCNATDMDLKEVYIALEKLLVQHRILIYEPGGQLVDTSLFAH